jgi:hypothetical protein
MSTHAANAASRHEAANVREAFEQRDEICASQRAFLQSYGLFAAPDALAVDADAADAMPGRRERRRDQILNRSRWQFGPRDEILHSWKGGAA